MGEILTAVKNILETSTVMLGTGTPNADYPISRLYDRNVGRIYTAEPVALSSGEEELIIKIDQGATSILAVDRLLIPAGHNFDGWDISIEHSADDITYTPAVTGWEQSGSALINKSFTSIIKQYWKLTITSPGNSSDPDPQFMELFLTQTYEWERNPGTPSGPIDDVFNVENKQTSGGQDRFIEHGDKRRPRDYSLAAVGQAQIDNIISFNDDWAGKKPFWLADIDSAWIYGKLRRPLSIRQIKDDLYSFRFDFIEVLP